MSHNEIHQSIIRYTPDRQESCEEYPDNSATARSYCIDLRRGSFLVILYRPHVLGNLPYPL